MMLLLEFIFFFSGLLILYHFIGYPLLLSFLSARRLKIELPPAEILHRFVFVIPMLNEAVFIEKKIENLAQMGYPSDQYDVLLLDDGSTDKSSQIANETSAKYPNLSIKIRRFDTNQGKVALFNQVIPDLPNECILFFSDVSAMLSPNTLKRANAYFNDPKVGAFCSKFRLQDNALEGEKLYWEYQGAIRAKESLLGTPIGFHGSGYALRKSLWDPLPCDTINDDFVMPMSVIKKGWLGIYDEECIATEMELSSERIDWNRRVRIAKGNIQQVGKLRGLLLSQHKLIAWMFFSSKVLRIFLPWLFLLALCSSVILSFYSPFLFLPIVTLQLCFYLLGLISPYISDRFKVISYFIKGQFSILMGWFSLFKKQGSWQRAKSMPKSHYVHPFVRCSKWIIDKISVVLGLAILIVLFPFIALIIKLSSPGAIFYKQLRVGKGEEHYTKLFYVYKFRTMRICTTQTDTTWTMVGDSRIFPFGKFLRKTHLDELPQFYNILIGDMSLIGPRPERPSLYSFIEQNIPFYEERLYGLLPGLTGLAQVTFDPDRTIEDVRKKVAFDHAYAIHLTKPWLWIKVESIIIIKTILNVLLGKGQ